MLQVAPEKKRSCQSVIKTAGRQKRSCVPENSDMSHRILFFFFFSSVSMFNFLSSSGSRCAAIRSGTAANQQLSSFDEQLIFCFFLCLCVDSLEKAHQCTSSVILSTTPQRCLQTIINVQNQKVLASSCTHRNFKIRRKGIERRADQ